MTRRDRMSERSWLRDARGVYHLELVLALTLALVLGTSVSAAIGGAMLTRFQRCAQVLYGNTR